MNGARGVQYAKAPDEAPLPQPIARDLNAERIAKLEADLNEQKLLLRQLAQRPTSTITTPTPPPPKQAPKERRFQPMQVVSKDLSDQWVESPNLHTLGAWSWIPCTVETVVNSEIEGYFTVKTKRVVKDVTGRHTLIPQGVSLGAKATTAKLLFGNERIPSFAVSFALPNGRAVDLGSAPIMDATGTNGLTGEVHNHTWRLIWTSVFMGGLQGGQQALQSEVASTGPPGQIIAGIGQEASQASRQRLGRAQDTRPTIIVHAGEACNVLVTAPIQLEAWAR
jgi:type IV secretion system protein VirB10